MDKTGRKFKCLHDVVNKPNPERESVIYNFIQGNIYEEVDINVGVGRIALINEQNICFNIDADYFNEVIPIIFKEGTANIPKCIADDIAKEYVCGIDPYEKETEGKSLGFHDKTTPNYYKTKSGKDYDVIDFVADYDLNFNKGNIIKYVARAGRKNENGVLADLRKAKDYIEREIEIVTRELSKYLPTD